MLNIGVIGIQGYGLTSLNVLTQRGDVTVTALCDLDETTTRRIAGERGIARVYTAYREMLRADVVDAVVIATPHFLHHPMTLAAPAAGKHVFCEKPLAMTREEVGEWSPRRTKQDGFSPATITSGLRRKCGDADAGGAGRDRGVLSRQCALDGAVDFVENRYTDWHRYWPHRTLRNPWKLAHHVDPVRLRMEWLNHKRNRDKYEGDPLAPDAYRPDYLFATVMFSSPLGWLEVASLPESYFAEAAPLIGA